jgi:hypothetical protein
MFCQRNLIRGAVGRPFAQLNHPRRMPDDRRAPATPPPPPQDPTDEKNPAHNLDEKQAYAGRPDQGVKKTTGAGAGGATEWGGGNKNHPSRIAGKPPGT